MRRAERLFQIIQILRRYRRPVRGHEIADELETSLRTIYRDIAELKSQRVPITGEAGMGYVLSGDYDMPPLMLTADELEAAVLGARWVAMRADPALKRGAQDLIAKIGLATPETLKPIIFDTGVAPVTFSDQTEDTCDVSLIREAIRIQAKVQLDYKNSDEVKSVRVIWPFLVAYSDVARFICAWCELRAGFRAFRTDRIINMSVLNVKFPKRVAVLRQEWDVCQSRNHGSLA